MISKAVILVCVVTASSAVYFGWKLTARGAYESAEYTVLAEDGPFEERQYPELVLATTNKQLPMQRDDGSFMRLFRYISGANDSEQKIAMTTPVFMEAEAGGSRGRMGFVIPKEVTAERVPEPSNENVLIRRRTGGRFAVYRFSGRAEGDTLVGAEDTLRGWMEDKGLVGEDDAEYAGYDPPWTPGPLRRNEILIRLK